MGRRQRCLYSKHTDARDSQHDTGGHKRQAKQQAANSHSQLKRAHESGLVGELSDRLANGHRRVQHSDMTRFDERGR